MVVFVLNYATSKDTFFQRGREAGDLDWEIASLGCRESGLGSKNQARGETSFDVGGAEGRGLSWCAVLDWYGVSDRDRGVFGQMMLKNFLLFCILQFSGKV